MDRLIYGRLLLRPGFEMFTRINIFDSGLFYCLMPTSWIPIFKTGKHTAMNGKTREWTAADLDHIVNSYDPLKSEAPEVIGHPKLDSPAFGWVAGLKREGNVLYFQAKDRVDDFVTMLKEKRFKKRSLALNADGTLKHIGWLGATPPAVKGLKDVAFGDMEKCFVYDVEFAERTIIDHHTIKGVFSCFSDWLKEREGAESANKIIIPDSAKPQQGDSKMFLFGKSNKKALIDEINSRPDEEFAQGIPTDLQGKPTPPKQEGVSFSQADIDQIKVDAIKEGKDAAALEYAQNLKKGKVAGLKKEVIAFCQQPLDKGGKVIPAWNEGGLMAFMESLIEEETAYEFAGVGKPKVSKYEFMKSFLENLPSVIRFAEIANHKTNTGNETVYDKMETLAHAKMGQNSNMTYDMAMDEVQLENPALVVEYQAEMGQVH